MADISLLPKEYSTKFESAPRSAGKVHALSYLLLFIVLAAWGGLYFYNKQTTDQISRIDEEIGAISFEGREQEVAKINEATEKLGKFKSILDLHAYPSYIFNAIEKLTLKNVYFGKFSLDTKKNEMFLSGVADSYASFAKQITALKTKSDFVRAIEIQSTRLSKEGVEFDLRIVMIDGVLVKK